MPCLLTLHELANLSIGTPEIGAVNFNALHTLIHAIIRHLKIQDVKTEITDDEKDFFKPLATQIKEEDKVEIGEPIRVPVGYEQLDRKIGEIAKQIDALNKWPTSADLLERSKEIPAGSPVGELWHMMQMKRKIESNADGISKAMVLLQDLVNEINTLKQVQESKEDDFVRMKELLSGQPDELEKQRNELESQRKDLENMHLILEGLDEKLSQYPSPSEVNNMVRWEILQDTLLADNKKLSDASSTESQDEPVPTKATQPSTRKTQPSATQLPQAKPSRIQPSAPATTGKGVAQPSARGSPTGPGTQPPSKGAPARPGAQQLTMGAAPGTGAQQATAVTPSGLGAQQIATGTPAGPGTQLPAMGPPTAPGAQLPAMVPPTAPGAQLPAMVPPTAPGAQLPAMGTPTAPGAQLPAMGTPTVPGAQLPATGTPSGPGVQQAVTGAPAGPGAQQTVMGMPSGPGVQQLATGIPAVPGVQQPEAQQPATRTLAGAGAQQSAPGGPAGPGSQELVTGIPTGPGAQQLPTGLPMVLGDEQFDVENIIEPEAQSFVAGGPAGPGAQPPARGGPTGPGAQPPARRGSSVTGSQPSSAGSSVGRGAQPSVTGSPGGPGTPQFAAVHPTVPGGPSPTGSHETMPLFPTSPELQSSLQEGEESFSDLEYSLQPGEPSPHPVPESSLQSSLPSKSTPASATSSRLGSASARYMETVRALRQIGQVAKLYGSLKEQVEELYVIKADRSELVQLPALQSLQGLQGLPGLQLPDADIPKLTTDVLEQLASLKDLREDLQENKQMDGELQKHIQDVILQLQDECEKLNSTTRHLIEDHSEKQKQIDLLYQSLEKLDEKKADKDKMELEFDVKATRHALESKVSRTQFDATAEQLNMMIQELLNKVTGQEQDWQKVIDKICNEMETKLDRMELDPFRRQLEDRWKSIRKQLKERSPTYELDDAAGIRKQLIAHFHCISCDRPVDMAVPGPQILTIPNVPGLPGHRSSRPYTVYELEQVRQHSRNMKSGITYARYEAVQMEKSINQLRRLHTCLRREIEKVQSHFGGSMRASTQTIRDMLQSRCLGLGQHRKRFDTKTITERVPEIDNSYMSNRSCGGSHTLTFPHRRYSRLQNITQYGTPPEEENITSIVKQGEVDILGMDGQIYKGRLDPRFPAIAGKEGMQSKTRLKPPQTPPKALTPIDPNSLPSRSQSAKISCRSQSSTALGKCGKDRPVTSQTALQLVDNLEVRIDVPMNRISSEETAMS